MDYYDKNKSDHHIFEGSDYFIKNLERFDPQNFNPSNQEIIMCRRKTNGFFQFEFIDKDYCFEVFDVGGARIERKKWFHCFEGLDCVIYFDKKAYEDHFTNRLEESLDMFEETVNFLPK
jgi:hypothetical protein